MIRRSDPNFVELSLPDSTRARTPQRTMATLNPYDCDFDLTKKDDMDLFLAANKPRKCEDSYDLTAENFETFATKVKRKIKEFNLNKDDNFSANITKDGITTAKMINSCYGEITLAVLKPQAQTVWIDTSGDIKKDKNTCAQLLEACA